MRHTIPMISGSEVDCFSRSRRVHSWGRGEPARIKRAYRRRERHTVRLVIAEQLAEL